MDFINKYGIDENDIIFIDGNEEELSPGLNVMMSRLMELYVENYSEPNHIDQIDDTETITVDFTGLTEAEMSELIKCATMNLKLEEEIQKDILLLS